MSNQNCYMLLNIRTTLSTWLKTKKKFKRNVNYHFRIGVSALTGSPYMTSRDRLWYVMTSSASHGDALILSGTDASIRGIIIWIFKINRFFGIGLVSELFYPPTYTSLSHDLIKANVLSLVNWCFNRKSKSYLCTSLKAGFFSNKKYD